MRGAGLDVLVPGAIAVHVAKLTVGSTGITMEPRLAYTQRREECTRGGGDAVGGALCDVHATKADMVKWAKGTVASTIGAYVGRITDAVELSRCGWVEGVAVWGAC